MRFRDRNAAGRLLARELTPYAGRNPVVVAIPRGGVPVGVEVASALGASLDVFVVRKIGASPPSEGGVVAVAEGGRWLVLDGTAGRDHAHERDTATLGARASSELERQARFLRDGRAPLDVKGRTVIVVDDGVVTGLTAWAAIKALRQRAPARLVLAVPVAPAPVAQLLGTVADEVVCLLSPDTLWSVGAFYGDFEPVSDEAAAACLRQARGEHAPRENVVSPAGRVWAGFESLWGSW